MKKIGYMPLNGGSWAKRPVLKKTGCNQSTTGLFDFQQTGQLATGLITIDHNWQLQSSCNQLWSSPVASLCTSCQLDFETLLPASLADVSRSISWTVRLPLGRGWEPSDL